MLQYTYATTTHMYTPVPSTYDRIYTTPMQSQFTQNEVERLKNTIIDLGDLHFDHKMSFEEISDFLADSHKRLLEEVMGCVPEEKEETLQLAIEMQYQSIVNMGFNTCREQFISNLKTKFNI